MTTEPLDFGFHLGQTLPAYLAEMFGTPAQQAADWAY